MQERATFDRQVTVRRLRDGEDIRKDRRDPSKEATMDFELCVLGLKYNVAVL
jgi:hypothetical protein